ncbi:hypothetical protein psyc5s11_23820 [Clostridium gelidum]|uniref:Uncharacterized protein n=1 Tax=Clostridium gelidum TaxID=704125 RepID=A0ABN6IVX0_9CLOT|nr:hypothetical protein psyc5s11_23820 [Clostridium gelidum]
MKPGSFNASIPPSVTGITDAVKEKGLEALINNLNFSFIIFLSPLLIKFALLQLIYSLYKGTNIKLFYSFYLSYKKINIIGYLKLILDNL